MISAIGAVSQQKERAFTPFKLYTMKMGYVPEITNWFIEMPRRNICAASYGLIVSLPPKMIFVGRI